VNSEVGKARCFSDVSWTSSTSCKVASIPLQNHTLEVRKLRHRLCLVFGYLWKNMIDHDVFKSQASSRPQCMEFKPTSQAEGSKAANQITSLLL
jgi:hypothetical protein